MDHFFGALKNEKLSAGVLIIVVVCVIWGKTWADQTYVTKEEFEATNEKIDSLQKTTQAHVEDFAIVSSTNAIRDIKIQLTLAKATEAPESEIASLEEQLEHEQDYKRCLIEQRPNCEYLRVVE